jgi:hypothetical protein
MFNKNVRALTGEEDEQTKGSIKHLWSRFGIEDETLFGCSHEPLISMSVPLSAHSRSALGELDIQMPATLEGQMTKGTPFKKATIGHRAILSSSSAWDDLFQVPGSSVHAGLCLEKPSNAANTFMQAMEAAQQHMHLRGTDEPLSALSWQYPSGAQYAKDPAFRLTGHHPKQRLLRDPDEGYALHYDARRQGFTQEGNCKNTWWVTDKKGDSSIKPFEIRTPASGALWRACSLESFLDGNEHESGRASRIGIRKDQFDKLSEFCYVLGIGLLKKP